MPQPIAKQAAGLARRASELLADDAASVGFAISHWKDHSGLFERVVDVTDAQVPRQEWGLPPDARIVWTETLTSASFGHGVIILVARTVALPSGDDAPPMVEITPGGNPLNQEEVFYGRSRPNPSFLYKGLRPTELSLRLPVAPETVRRRDALALGATIHRMTEVARAVDAPLAFLQSPLAPPGDDASEALIETVGEAGWREAGGFGARFAIALRADDTEARLEVYRQLRLHATATGAELWIGDQRGDSRGGQHVRLAGPDRGRYESWSKAKFPGPEADEPVRWALPVTFVGPARIGTSEAITSSLVAAGVPILSSAIAALENLAFIQLLVALPDDRDPFAGNDRHGPAASVVGRLVGGARPASGPPADYSACVGRPSEVRGVSSPDESGMLAIWAAWRFPDQREALDAVVSTLREAIEEGTDTDLAARVNIVYMLCRRLESGYLSGRCKLAVPSDFDPKDVPARLSGARAAKCKQIQGQWRTLLAARVDSPMVDVEFSWQELRLGRWHALRPAP